MIEALKKKSFKSSLLGTISLFLVGIALTLFSARNAWSVVAGYKQFTTLSPEQIQSSGMKRQFVEVDLRNNYGCFLEEYEKNSNTHVKKTTGYYYVIYTGAYDDTESDYVYMAIKVPPSYMRKMENMADKTYEGELSKKLELFGSIEEMSSSEYRYFKEFWQDMGFSDEEIKEKVIPYYVDVFANRAFINVTVMALFLGGVACLVWGIIRLIKGKRGDYVKQFIKDITDAGYTEAAAESDYASAFSYDKQGGFKVGRIFTFCYMNASKPRAIPNSKILWAYQNTVTHRTNGIKTGTTYDLVLWVDGDKKNTAVLMPNADTVQDVLKRMNEMFPWVVVGFTQELSSLFHKDRAQFMNLRYNTVEHNTVEPGFEGFNQDFTTPAQ